MGPILRGAAALLLLVQGGCVPAAAPDEATARADPTQGELAARPQAVTRAAKTGLMRLENARGRSGLLYVPESYRPGKAAPLVVMLHGAGGTAQHSMDLARRHADRSGFILLAPASAAPSWDIISRRAYGPDVSAIDGALKDLFARYSVDSKRVAIAGFSDGASYALSLGLTNGELFTDILAFSPGFTAPAKSEGRPGIFISHGVRDQVLPIDVCSRRIVPQLQRAGYHVDYREFPDGHSVPPELARAAFDRLTEDRGG